METIGVPGRCKIARELAGKPREGGKARRCAAAGKPRKGGRKWTPSAAGKPRKGAKGGCRKMEVCCGR